MYNERFLLPFWLKHHVRLFDHGVIVDHHSTDESVALVREYAPHWEVRTSRLPDFSARQTDQEMMDLEKNFPGQWKVILNTTEFLFHYDLNTYLAKLSPDISGVKMHGLAIVDHPAQRQDALAPDLFSQKFFGYSEHKKGRLLHRWDCGDYDVGRHSWKNMRETHFDQNLFCLWFGWCPIDHIKERKLQIQHRIPQVDKDVGFGFHHLLTEIELEERYRDEVQKADWFLNHEPYRNMLLAIHARYNLTICWPNL